MSLDGVATTTDEVFNYRHSSRSEMLDFVPCDRRELKVLEIGCGDGSFLASIPNAAERWGVEPYEPAAREAETRVNNILATTFEIAKPQLQHDYFDLVICNDVIEHMTDHDAFLISVQDVMAEGSVLIGSLPNVRYYKNLFNLLVTRDWEYENYGILDRTHFRFFTQKSIRRSLERAGFRVQRLEGITGGFESGYSLRLVAPKILAYGMIALSGGLARDVRYLQFGFRAAKPKRSPEAL